MNEIIISSALQMVALAWMLVACKMAAVGIYGHLGDDGDAFVRGEIFRAVKLGRQTLDPVGVVNE